MTTVAITGATGNVGRQLVLALLEQGLQVRAIGRSTDRLAGLVQRGAEGRAGSLDDARFLSEAFRGADAAWVMIPPAHGDSDPRGHQARVTEALAVGLQVARVRHAASLSSIGADQPAGNGPIAGLHALEQRLNAVPGLNLVHLRPGYFFENHLGAIGLIKGAGVNGGHFHSDLPIPMIATRDVARAAALLLSRPAFAGHRVQELQGPRDYTMREVTTILGTAIGRPELPYVEFSAADFHAGLLAAGIASPMADLFVEMIHGFNTGHCHALTTRSAETTTPTTLEQWAREVFAPAFGG